MSTIPDGFRRVSRHRRCPVCNHADWCLVSDWGALCPREPNATGETWGDCGYLHVTGERPAKREWIPRKVERVEPAFDAERLAEACRFQLSEERLAETAADLGVKASALRQLHVGYSLRHGAHTFPMRDHNGRVVGIRLRRMADAFKWAVTGSRAGLMFDPDHPQGDALYTCEGPTDAAALLGLGLWTVARPSCTGGVDMLKQYVAAHQPMRVVVMADTDTPGIEGAATAATRLRDVAKSVKVIVPLKGKDARAWVCAGATRETVENVVHRAREWAGNKRHCASL